MMMPKGVRKGIVATHLSEGPRIHPFEYWVDGTAVTLRRAANDWRLIGFNDATVFPKQGGKLILQISPEQETAAIEAMRAACGIAVKKQVVEPALSTRAPLAFEP